MRAFDIAVPTTAKSLKELIQNTDVKTRSINFQAPVANIGTIFFGDRSVQPAELDAGGAATLNEATFGSTYIKGTNGDRLTVLLFNVD